MDHILSTQNEDSPVYYNSDDGSVSSASGSASDDNGTNRFIEEEEETDAQPESECTDTVSEAPSLSELVLGLSDNFSADEGEDEGEIGPDLLKQRLERVRETVVQRLSQHTTHKKRSLLERLTIIEYYDQQQTKNLSEIQRKFGVKRSTFRQEYLKRRTQWEAEARERLGKQSLSNVFRSTGGGRKPHFPGLEAQLKHWHVASEFVCLPCDPNCVSFTLHYICRLGEKREKGERVYARDLWTEAEKHRDACHVPTNARLGKNWKRGVKRRLGLRFRKETRRVKVSREEAQLKLRGFHTYIQTIHNYHKIDAVCVM